MITDPNKGNDLCTNRGGIRHDAMARFWCPDCQAATFEASGNHEEAARRRAKAAAQRTRPDPYDVFAKPNGYNHDKPSAPPAARGDVEAWHRVPDLQRLHDIRRKIRYAEQTLDRVCAEIAAMPADSGRNQATNDAAMRVGHLVGAGWLDLNRAHDALADACTRAGPTNARQPP